MGESVFVYFDVREKECVLARACIIVCVFLSVFSFSFSSFNRYSNIPYTGITIIAHDCYRGNNYKNLPMEKIKR